MHFDLFVQTFITCEVNMKSFAILVGTGFSLETGIAWGILN